MELVIQSVDYAPEELYTQTPFRVHLVRQLRVLKGGDHWLGELRSKLIWLNEGQKQEITHIIVSERWVGVHLPPKTQIVPVNIAYVIDQTLLTDEFFDFDMGKSKFVAIGAATDGDGKLGQ